MDKAKHEQQIAAVAEPKDRSQFRPDLLALAGLNPWPEFISSSRTQMFTNHIGQALVIEGAEPRLCQTGLERKLGEFTFSKRIPVNSEIIAVIPRFPPTLDGRGRENNCALVIYENAENNEICSLEITNYFSLHQHFGFSYKYTKAYSNLTVREPVKAGTVLAQSPAVSDNGDYGYGVNANVAAMTVEGTIEDGVIVRRGFLEKLKTKGYGRRIINFGSKHYPLNLFGDENNYKFIPDIGERVGGDGLLCALREKDPLLDALNMHPDRLKEVDYYPDETLYAEPNARIIDVIVHHSPGRKEQTPIGMSEQAQYYWNVEKNYHEAIIKTYEDLKRRRGEKLLISPAFNRLVVEAMGRSTVRLDPRQNKNRTLNKTYRMQMLDEYRVEVVFEYDITPDIGYKLTGCHGDGPVLTGCHE